MYIPKPTRNPRPISVIQMHQKRRVIAREKEKYTSTAVKPPRRGRIFETERRKKGGGVEKTWVESRSCGRVRSQPGFGNFGGITKRSGRKVDEKAVGQIQQPKNKIPDPKGWRMERIIDHRCPLKITYLHLRKFWKIIQESFDFA
jgi:hypothetical protein